MPRLERTKTTNRTIRAGLVDDAWRSFIATQHGYVAVADYGTHAILECIAHGRLWRRTQYREHGTYVRAGLVRIAGQFARDISALRPFRKGARRHLKVA